jgi:hypothetical protein
MTPIKKIVLAAMATALMLSAFAGTATALRSLSLSRSTKITLLSREVTFGGTVFGIGAKVVCEVGMSIDVNSNPIAKSARTNIGTAEVKVLGQETGAERCTEGRARTLRAEQRLPYRLNYLGFTGTLPRVTGILLQLLGIEFLIRNGPNECLYRANALGLQRVRTEAGATGTLENLEGPGGRPEFSLESIVLVENLNPFFGACPRAEDIFLQGIFTPKNGPITIRLI